MWIHTHTHVDTRTCASIQPQSHRQYTLDVTVWFHMKGVCPTTSPTPHPELPPTTYVTLSATYPQLPHTLNHKLYMHSFKKSKQTIKNN